MRIKRALEANAQLAERSKLGMHAFGNPAMLAEPTVLLNATATDPGAGTLACASVADSARSRTLYPLILRCSSASTLKRSTSWARSARAELRVSVVSAL